MHVRHMSEGDTPVRNHGGTPGVIIWLVHARTAQRKVRASQEFRP